MNSWDGALAQGGAKSESRQVAGERYALRIAAHREQLPRVQEFVSQRADGLHISTKALHDVLVAVTEIVTNSVEHGYAGGPGIIDIEIWMVGRDLYICVRDEAPPFDPTGVPAPDISLPLEARSPGGMGIHMARHFTDDMTYRALPQGGNELVLIRNNAAEQGEA